MDHQQWDISDDEDFGYKDYAAEAYTMWHEMPRSYTQEFHGYESDSDEKAGVDAEDEVDAEAEEGEESEYETDGGDSSSDYNPDEDDEDDEEDDKLALPPKKRASPKASLLLSRPSKIVKTDK
jgi:hypothetical protein